MLSDDEIYQRMTPIFREVFDDDDLEIEPDMSASDIDEWDSLSHIRLIVSNEIEFGVKFTTSEITKLENIGEFVSLLKIKLR